MDPEYERNEKFRELCSIGDLDLIRRFYSAQSPDINSKNKVNGWTALHWASKRNHISVVKYLVEIGAFTDNLNNDGKTAVYYTKNEEIQKLLLKDSENKIIEIQASFEPTIIPAYLQNPQFHYSDKSLFNFEETNQNKEEASSNKYNSTTINSPKNEMVSNSSQNQDIITVRLRANIDEDFIEVDIDRLNATFDEFKGIIVKELDHLDKKLQIFRIRKLPNILIRNTNDIKRLKNDQEIEVIFV